MTTNFQTRQIAVPLDLELVGPHIQGVVEAVDDELRTLRNHLQPIMDTWSGSAQTYYSGLQDEWNIAAEGLLGPEGVLGRIATAMNITWRNYTECEWANTQTWQHH